MKDFTAQNKTYNKPPSHRRHPCSRWRRRTTCRVRCTSSPVDTKTYSPSTTPPYSWPRPPRPCNRHAHRSATGSVCKWRSCTEIGRWCTAESRNSVRPSCHRRRSRSSDHTSSTRRCTSFHWHSEIHSADKRFHLDGFEVKDTNTHKK